MALVITLVAQLSSGWTNQYSKAISSPVSTWDFAQFKMCRKRERFKVFHCLLMVTKPIKNSE